MSEQHIEPYPAAQDTDQFMSMNAAYNQVFQISKLSIGLTCPIEAYPNSPVPTMCDHLARVKLAESLGFSAVWLRDVPFNVPSFGDAGQCFDPFVYLGFLAAQTSTIALGVASIILPLRHPAHTAKAAASVDTLSGGRLLLGIASGDRAEEYPALDVPYEQRGIRFRESYAYMRQVALTNPEFRNPFGSVSGGMDLLPKPESGQVPMLITGGSQQSADWVARNGNGWMTYPRGIQVQESVIADWRARVAAVGRAPQPVVQPLYIDLVDDPSLPLRPIHLGYRCGIRALRAHLKALESIGINHVAMNLRFNESNVETTLKRLAHELLADFGQIDE